MLPEMQPQTPTQRAELLERMVEKVKEHFGAQLLGIGLYGSTAKGSDEAYSDLEMFCLLNSQDEDYTYEWVEGANKVEINVYSQNVALANAAAVDTWWAVEQGQFYFAQPLYGDPALFQALKNPPRDPALFAEAMSEIIIGDVYEIISKLKNGRHQADHAYLLLMTSHCLEYGALLLGLAGRYIYHSYATMLLESLALAPRPSGYDELCALFRSGQLSDPAPVVAALENFWEGLKTWAEEQGIELKSALPSAILGYNRDVMLTRFKHRLQDFANEDDSTILAALIFLGFSVLIAVLGYRALHSRFDWRDLAGDFYANTAAELGSIAVTVLIIDRLNARRATRQEKQALVLQMGSPDHAFAVEAVRRLRARGWLRDRALQKANLTEADLSETDLEGANLAGATLKHANLTGTRLQGVQLRGAHLGGANLAKAFLEEANLTQADLLGANLLGAYLNGAKLSEAQLSGAKLIEANLERADLTKAELVGADLSGASLYKTNLTKANLHRANLFGVELERSTLAEADLQDADLRMAKTCDIDLRGANLHLANLSRSILNHAVFDDQTILPDGQHWTPQTDLHRFTDPNHPDCWQVAEASQAHYDEEV